MYKTTILSLVLCCLCALGQRAYGQTRLNNHEVCEMGSQQHHLGTSFLQSREYQISDTVHILSCGHCPPYDFVNTSGEHDGYIIALLEDILRRHKISYRIHDLSNFMHADSLLLNGAVLVPTGYIEKASWRADLVRALPLYQTHPVAVVLQESPIQSVEELSHASIAHAVKMHCSKKIKEYKHVHQDCFFGSVSDCSRMLFAGEVDAMEANREVLAYYMSHIHTDRQLRELTAGTRTHYLYVDPLHTELIPIIERELLEMQEDGFIENLRQRYMHEKSDNAALISIYFGFYLTLVGLLVTVAYYWFIFRKKYARWRKEQRAARILKSMLRHLPARLSIRMIPAADLDSQISPYSLSDEVYFYKRYFIMTDLLPDGLALVCDADVTDMEVLSKNQDKSDSLRISLLTNLSHEIRTPLSTVLRFTQLLVEEEDEMEQSHKEQCLTLIRKNSELMLKMVTDLVDNPTKRIPSIKDETQPINCVELMREIEFQYLSILSRDSISFEVMMPFDTLEIQGNKARVMQVIHNLLDNAIKFTNSGKIQCGMTISETQEVVFFCRDTGVGISEEHIPLIFERFYTVDDDSTDSGLGLSICRSIVERVEGTLDVASKKGRGSLFWASVPLQVDYQYNKKRYQLSYTHILSEISNHIYGSDE